MHYYKFNIGDYVSATQHLEPLEDLAYRRMLDIYYLNEKPLPNDVEQVARLIRMRTHCECITNVLNDFFVLEEDGFHCNRVDVELFAFREKSEKAANSAKTRWNKSKEKQQVKTISERNANALKSQSECNANQEPLTKNQEPRTKNQEPVNKESEQVQLLFEFWQKVMNKSNVKLSTGRKSKITARLKDYSFDEIYQAIENCSKSKFHMGMNDNNKQYNDIELICRNCEKLESFRDMPVISDQLQNFSSQEQRNIINSQEWLNEQ